MTNEQPVSVGRIVHVRISETQCRPAIVTAVHSPTSCNVRVFHEPSDAPGMEFRTSVSLEPEPRVGGTWWHWPERA